MRHIQVNHDRSFKWVSHQPQKAHLQPLSVVCVQYEKNPQWVSEICFGNKALQDIMHIKVISYDGMYPPPQLRRAEDNWEGGVGGGKYRLNYREK